MRKIGFTGTQKGMTKAQRLTVRQLLMAAQAFDTLTLHHGDCIGADEQADRIAAELSIKRFAHPCDLDHKRAYCKADFIAKVMRPLDRNKVIVRNTDEIIGAPSSKREQRRSGTWSTIRYARKLRRPVMLVFPDGMTQLIEAQGGFLK